MQAWLEECDATDDADQGARMVVLISVLYLRREARTSPLRWTLYVRVQIIDMRTIVPREVVESRGRECHGSQ